MIFLLITKKSILKTFSKCLSHLRYIVIATCVVAFSFLCHHLTVVLLWADVL